jgi:regulator of sigma E protease
MEALSGPVGMTQSIGESVAGGFESFLYIFVIITVNLGVFNLLPIPALDGGRLLFLLVEAVIRRPLNPKIEGYIHAVALLLLLGLAAVVTFNDIIRLF